MDPEVFADSSNSGAVPSESNEAAAAATGSSSSSQTPMSPSKVLQSRKKEFGDRMARMLAEAQHRGRVHSLSAPFQSTIDQNYQPKQLKKFNFTMAFQAMELLDLTLTKVSKVLVLYTGGTIGMKSENGAYVPVANYLGDAIRHTKVLHDNQCLRSLMTEDDWEIATDTSLGAVDLPFALPTSVGNRTLLYVIYEYEPLLDSSDMTMDDHLRIAADIGLEYDFFDGFVILHGTDTMCYTASALSFLLENLGKPVIVTGSQIPIIECRSDGRDNFLGALILAGFYCVPEVCVFFHNELLRGNRCTKISTNDFDAFASPNCNPLAKLGIDVHVYWHRVLGADHTRKFRVHDTLCNQVILLRLFPSMTTQLICEFLKPPIRGLVLQSYGAGNFPINDSMLAALREASDRGVLVVNISQCQRGPVSVIYRTGQVLAEAGVLSGADMVPEAALSKLAYVLSKEDWPLEHKRRKLQRSLRGEATSVADFSEGVEQDGERRAPIDQARTDQPALLDRMCAHLSDQCAFAGITLSRDYFAPALLNALAVSGHFDRAEQLLRGSEFNLATLNSGKYKFRAGPLHLAAAHGRTDMVRYLLRRGAALHAKDERCRTALDIALDRGDAELAQLLASVGGASGRSLAQTGSRLNALAATGDLASLRMHWTAGSDLRLTDYNRFTPLHTAALHGHLHVVRFLCREVRVPAKPLDLLGRSPLQLARDRGCDTVTAFLETLPDYA
ncbi:hypothetical protein BOX15_Mlig016677g2 [Macrostomum lignano]|uniref:asparaginase n=1 Tax=Macrostomum lignano TaxID=282301 RepID=A0A267DQT5_9PLAT|nr:hypothetical protein BOX15_Mlig016677g2 [Macrostomum lignano]